MNAKELLNKMDNGEILPKDLPGFDWDYGVEGGYDRYTGKALFATTLHLTLHRNSSETVDTWEGTDHRTGWKRLMTIAALHEIDMFGRVLIEFEGWDVIVTDTDSGARVRIDLDGLADRADERVKEWTQAIDEQLGILLEGEGHD